jgi:phosphatidylglycerophosphatase A
VAAQHGAESGGCPTVRKTRWAWLVGTFFGAGYLQPGPGTYGSVAAVVLWLFAGWALHHHTATLTGITAGGVVLATAAGIPAATRVAREAGREDPGFVVIDEVAGQWVALLFVAPLWPNALLALILFRFFDILKPWPIRRFEALPGGLGIMADDLVAGGFALLFGQLMLHFLHKLG